MALMNERSVFIAARPSLFLLFASRPTATFSLAKRRPISTLQLWLPAESFLVASILNDSTIGSCALAFTARAMACVLSATERYTSERSSRRPSAFSQQNVCSFTSSPPYIPAPDGVDTQRVMARNGLLMSESGTRKNHLSPSFCTLKSPCLTGASFFSALLSFFFFRLASAGWPTIMASAMSNISFFILVSVFCIYGLPALRRHPQAVR